MSSEEYHHVKHQPIYKIYYYEYTIERKASSPASSLKILFISQKTIARPSLPQYTWIKSAITWGLFSHGQRNTKCFTSTEAFSFYVTKSTVTRSVCIYLDITSLTQEGIVALHNKT